MNENYKVNNNNDIPVIDKKFDYQLIQNSTYKQNELCYAIDFNKDATIMILGCYNSIKVYEFKDNKLREVQQLNGHLDNVTCLQFMKKSNQFISASLDSNIVIWEYNQNNQWQNNQVLKGHKSVIYCVTMNQNEDLLISGSKEKTIKFWNKYNNIWCYNQSIDCQSQVYSVSLSNKENQLIASGYNDQILVIQLQGRQWIIKQKISIDEYGNRLCFINQNQFIVQPIDSQYLYQFDYDPQDQTFKKRQEIKYTNEASDENYFFPISFYLFPIRYVSKIGLIMVKSGQNIHLIKRSQNDKFTVEQSIDFNANDLFGCVSEDGRYIATWDFKTNEIQIRKFDY